jgi:nucleoside diphosphate kinase
MAVERTLSIIKPDAVEAGLRIIAARMEHLSAQKAGEFYAVHKERPFYNDLVEFMTSGPVMVQVLEGEDAIAKVPSVRTLRKPSMKTQCMARTVPILRGRKSNSFLAAMVFARAHARPVLE